MSSELVYVVLILALATVQVFYGTKKPVFRNWDELGHISFMTKVDTVCSVAEL